MARSAFLFCLIISSAGCTLGADYVRPPDAVPGSFTAAASTEPVLPTTPWWLSLNDRLLEELVERARRANPDVARAKAAVKEARAALALAEGGGAPQLNGTGSLNYGRSFTAPGYYGRAMGYSTAGFDASWEIDLWGRERRTVEAASANAESVVAEANDALLTLLGDLARTYVELRGTQSQIATTRLAIANQRRATGLAARRFDGGDGSKLDVLQGETVYLQQQSQLPLLEAQARVSIHAIATLCGEPPEALNAQLEPGGPVPQGPVPAVGIPADLLRRRPDVRAAERQLAATTALIGAAIADKYPSVSLSGSLSLSGSSVASILALPLFALAPTVKLPILDGGRREAVVDIRKAQAEQARFAYRTAVLKALREVEDAMARLKGETLHRDQVKLTIGIAQRSLAVASSLYTVGATDFLQVLEAQKALNQGRDALSQAEAARTIQVVALFKALGGGWDVAAGPAPERIASR